MITNIRTPFVFPHVIVKGVNFIHGKRGVLLWGKARRFVQKRYKQLNYWPQQMFLPLKLTSHPNASYQKLWKDHFMFDRIPFIWRQKLKPTCQEKGKDNGFVTWWPYTGELSIPVPTQIRTFLFTHTPLLMHLFLTDYVTNLHCFE